VGTAQGLTPGAAHDWSGLHFGVHMGAALGRSHWSAPPNLSGTLDFGNGYNFSTGNGSYFVGIHAGYDYMIAPSWLVGVSADFTAPSLIGGDQTFFSASTGSANYSERVQMSGNVLGRAGFAAGPWLFYAAGGMAWSFDQFTRTQLAGTPVGGTAVPGTVETASLVGRLGGAIGGGVEVALNSHWSAQIQYLFADYGPVSVTFPAAAQPFDSKLYMHTLRGGFDYRFGGNTGDSPPLTTGIAPLELERFLLFGETSFIEQAAPAFRSPYIGAHSLIPREGREGWDLKLFAGVRLWDGAEFWIDPEIDQGFGLSDGFGTAGYVNGAAIKSGSSVPYARIQRAFLRQNIDLGGGMQKLGADQHQFATSQTNDRLVFWVGKFSVTDVFDKNKYAQDPHHDFLNFALIDTGTFDFAADGWGYTYGAAAEWYSGDWAIRGGLFDAPTAPGSSDLDISFGQFQWVAEIERRWVLWSHPGRVALTGFLSRAQLGSFADAVALAQALGVPADTAPVRQYRSRSGLSVNYEQEITPDLGVFMRAGMANGNVEPLAYTDIDRTIAGGIALKGTQWGRASDTVGVAAVVNGVSSAHLAYLNSGGLGIEIGDGQLPHAGLEKILEAYYQFPVATWQVTFDYQFIANPGYNADRGPASVVAARLHTHF
jgi:high affinity Mn2+ porin